MKKLQLYSVASPSCVTDGFEHHFLCLSGQAENNMGYHTDADFAKIYNGLVVGFERIAAADISGGLRMDRLQAELYPDGLDFVKLRKQAENLAAQTVGSGGY